MDTETTPVQMSVEKELIADKVVQWIILAIVFLAPIFFIPSTIVSFHFAKIFILYTGIIAAFCACTVARLRDGRLSMTRHYLYIALAAIPVTYALSSIFSPVRSTSLIGQGFEVGTLSFIIGVTLLAFFVSYFFTTKKSVLYAYLAFLLPVPLVALFQFVRLLVGQNTLTFNVFASQTATLLGGWNDLGIYFGVVALFSFITLELLDLDRWIRISFISLLAISLFFLSIINFSAVWYLLAGFALIFFVYNFSFNKAHAAQDAPMRSTDSKRTIPIISLIVLLISVIFILIRGNIYSAGNDLFNVPFFNKLVVSNVEVRPSWMTTFDVAKSALRSDPIFGVGPNRFATEWLEAKPSEINSTIFWATDFNYGIGLVPTFLTTTGILGTLAWVVFFLLFLYMGFKALFTKTEDSFLGYVSVSSFILATYLWIFAYIYVPSAPLLIFTFFFTGIFLASAIQMNLIRIRSFSFVRDPRTSFVSVLIFIVLLLGLLVSSYTFARRFIASMYFNRALVNANIEGNIEKAEANMIHAIQLSEQDQFYRSLSDLNLVRINILLAQQNVSQEVLQNQFRSYLATSQNAAQTAVNLDSTNYQNWLQLGRTYEAIVPFKVEGAYEKAQESYTKARDLNPKSPAIPLLIARLDVAQNDITKAKAEINQALALKPDYTDAIFLLAQIQVNEGDLKSAITSVESAAYLNPNNSGIYFQLGLLRYENKDYAGAASAFEQAITLTPDYANAKYFLGLAYFELKRVPDAIAQFEAIKSANPENAEIDTIITNLKAGRAPVANTTGPLDSSRPPVKQEQKKADTQDR